MPEEVGEHVDDVVKGRLNLPFRLLKTVIGETSCCYS